jgi:hypothetical protein
MSHAIAPRASWLAMPRVLVPVGPAIVLVFLLFAAALWADRSTEETLAGPQADLVVTHDALSAHATTMRGQGERLRPLPQSTTAISTDLTTILNASRAFAALRFPRMRDGDLHRLADDLTIRAKWLAEASI